MSFSDTFDSNDYKKGIVSDPNGVWKGDDTIRYMTFESADYTNDSSISSVTDLKITANYTYCALSWTPPSDYDTTPENYLGFCVTRSRSATPTSPTDGTIAYAGRKSSLGEYIDVGEYSTGSSSSPAMPCDLIFADVGLNPATKYYYSVFVLKVTKTTGGFKYTYSNPSSTSVTTTTEAPADLIQGKGTFTTGSTDPWTISNTAQAEIITNDDPLTSGIFSKALRLTPQAMSGSTPGDTTTASYTIELNSTELLPNQLYGITYWTRGNDVIYTPTVSISGSTAIEGAGENSTSSNGNFQSQQNIATLTPNPGASCSASDNTTCEMTAEYKQGAIYDSYLDTEFYGEWRQHGLMFLTGMASDSDLLTLYTVDGSAFATVQKAWDNTENKVLVTIQLSIAGETAKNPSPVSGKYADFANVQLFAGNPPVIDQIERLTINENMIQNPKFIGSSTDLASNWTLSGTTIDNSSAQMRASCTTKAHVYQNFYWLTLKGGVQYTLSFKLNFHALSTDSCNCGGDPGPCDLANQLLTVELQSGFGTDATVTSGGSVDNTAEWEYTAQQYSDATDKDADGFVTISYQFTLANDVPRPRLSFYIDQKIAGQGTDTWGVDIKEPSFPSTGKETAGNWPVPNPFLPAAAVDADAFNSTYSVQWLFDEMSDPDDVLKSIYEDSARSQGVKLGPDFGLLCLAQKDSEPSNLKLVDSFVGGDGTTVNTSALEITAYGLNHADTSKQRTGATITTSDYLGSGYFECHIQFGEVTGNDPSADGPIGMCLASWMFHYITYDMTTGAGEMGGASPVLNSEIDIETPASCTRGGTDFSFTRGRLNGWGAQLQRGEGGNFENHFNTPSATTGSSDSINIADGKAHKLQIIWNSGYDFDPSSQTATKTRYPGFIKWRVDNLEWSCGWLGNQYGSDDVPFRAMRWVVGCWFPENPTDPDNTPGWAGMPNFDTAKVYITELSHRVIGVGDLSAFDIYHTLPSHSNPVKTPAPNRDTYQPESSPMMHYSPYQTQSDDLDS